MIETDRLVLRPAADADRDAIAALNAHPEVGAWLGRRAVAEAESDAFVDRVQAHQVEHGFGFWVVEAQGRRPSDRHDRNLVGPARDGHAGRGRDRLALPSATPGAGATPPRRPRRR
ncbi:GNAT family N-acetyltransferase [Caulobacter segnis]